MNSIKSGSALCVLVLSACASVRGVSQDSSPPPVAVSAVGQVVTEIDLRIWCIHQDRNGNYWFGSNGNGVYLYDGQRITHYTRADGLSGDQVRDIDDDTRGNVIISTTDGVSKFDGMRFTTLELVEAPRTGEGWILDPDDVWILFDPGLAGPCRYDGEKLYHLTLPKSPTEDAYHEMYPNSSFSPAGLYSIYKDRRGHVWFGTAGVGLCRYDGRTLSWMYEERLTTTPEGGAFGIRSMYQDRAGDYWICNTRQRFEISPEVMVKDGQSLVAYRKKEGLPDAQSDRGENFMYFPSMTEDAGGALWMVCGSDGVWRFDGEKVTRYTIGDGAYAICIHCDTAGRIRVGTLKQGIFLLEGEAFTRFTLDTAAPGFPPARE
jgi:ligand-binding sensor domain-containing protein